MKLETLAKLDNRVLRLSKILLGLCLLTPLLAWSGVVFPYTAPKAFAFRILVELAAVCYLYLALKYPARFLPFFSKSPFSLSPFSKGGWEGFLLLSISAFLAVNFVAVFSGLDFYRSFWGNLERMTGVWGLLHFAAWFFMLVAVFQTQKDRGVLLKISVAMSALVAFLAILQKFFSLGDLMPQTARVFSTIGNPAFLGTYLLFNIFFAAYLFLAASGKSRWLFTICDLLLAIGLLLTGTRGAYLGLLAGGIVFFVLLFFAGRSFLNPPLGGLGGFKKLSVIVLFIIVIFGGVLFAARDSAFVKNNSVLARVASVSLSDATIQSRLILWQGSWRAWLLRPILGYGAENFEAAANPHLSARLFSFEAFSLDRAHNFIFDYGVTLGWLGLAAYLTIFTAAGWGLKKIKDCHFAAVFGGLLAAYLAQNLFVFDSFVSYLMLFFTLGMIYVTVVKNLLQPLPSLGSGQALKEGRNFTPLFQRGVGGDFPLYKKFILFVFAVLVTFSLYSFNIKPLRAAYAAHQILASAPENRGEIAPRLSEALSLGGFASEEIAYQATLNYLSKVSQGQLTLDENFYKVASGALNKFIAREPAQNRNYIALAWLNLYFSENHPERVKEALDLAGRAKILSPNKKDVFLLLTAGYSLSGESLRAQEIVSQAEAADAKIGKEVREYWEKIK